MLVPGSRIGPYRILCLLGAGGMGEVHEAFHEVIERRVAIKVLHAAFGQNPQIVERFLNEARAVNRIEHPALVQVYDCGMLPDGSPYLVMELLKGGTIAQQLRQHGRFAILRAYRITQTLAEVLSQVHAKQIIHRDLKPDNVMQVEGTAEPAIKILDFGIAKLLAGSGIASATIPGTVMGSPAFMAPEQWQSEPTIDGKADVYSLGVMLFQLLSGLLPFQATSQGELCWQHLKQAPPPLQPLVPDLPAAMADLVMRMLAKSKEDRPSMVDIARSLAEWSMPLPQRTLAHTSDPALSDRPTLLLSVVPPTTVEPALCASDFQARRPAYPTLIPEPAISEADLLNAPWIDLRADAPFDLSAILHARMRVARMKGLGDADSRLLSIVYPSKETDACWRFMHEGQAITLHMDRSRKLSIPLTDRHARLSVATSRRISIDFPISGSLAVTYLLREPRRIQLQILLEAGQPISGQRILFVDAKPTFNIATTSNEISQICLLEAGVNLLLVCYVN